MLESDTPSPNPQTSRASHRPLRVILSNIGILLIAPLVALLLITFVFQSYQVEGYSMQNTLQDGDRLIVWKGSRTWARIVGTQYIPNRGDVIIVNQNNLTACGQSSGKQIVKRVIGLPGDRVVYKDGQYAVYNTQYPNGFNPDETLPYGEQRSALLNNPDASDVDVNLSSTQLFVSGDHRADSCDSRYFGPIQTSSVIGKVVTRIFPLKDAERF